MVLVTHEIRFAREVADEVVFMDGGVIVEQGPPAEVIDNPRHERHEALPRPIAQLSHGERLRPYRPRCLLPGRAGQGVGVTVGITLGALAIAIVLGLVLATLKVSRLPLARPLVDSYVEVFRDIPPLTQLL
jgi:hypothetical protein